jgi:hypothetical protein
MSKRALATKTEAPVLKRLEVVVCEWSEEEQAFESPNGPAAKVTAAETFEWLPGELFLLHRLDRTLIDDDTLGSNASRQS